MTLPELLEFTTSTEQHLRAKFGADMSDREWATHGLAKVMEELGELSAEILGRYNYQRPGKAKQFDQDSLDAELADVLLSTIILGHELGVDIPRALTTKITKIKTR